MLELRRVRLLLLEFRAGSLELSLSLLERFAKFAVVAPGRFSLAASVEREKRSHSD